MTLCVRFSLFLCEIYSPFFAFFPYDAGGSFSTTPPLRAWKADFSPPIFSPLAALLFAWFI